MISLGDVSHVVAAIIPLYVAMFLAYASVKWCKLFTPEQCSGINKFVAKFSIPLLSFNIISETNPYTMNLKVILSDVLQKAFALIVLIVVTKIKPKGGLRWIISGLSLLTLPNTLIVGIPLIRPMYGDETAGLLAQIVVLQSIIWYNILLFLYEFCAAKEGSETIPISESTQGSTEASEEAQPNEVGQEAGYKPASKTNKTMNILKIVGKKLISNPNTHATVLGLIWASIHFRWNLELPDYVDKSISILGVGGLGMAMFSIGLFMASRPRIIACGTKLALLTMAMRIIMGPVLMAASSLAVGLRGTMFRFAVVQASLPLGIVPFVYAREYNVYPEIFSTGIVFGMIVAVPVALAYYILLAF